MYNEPAGAVAVVLLGPTGEEIAVWPITDGFAPLLDEVINIGGREGGFNYRVVSRKWMIKREVGVAIFRQLWIGLEPTV